MPFPELSQPQFAWLVQQVSEYIETQRQTYRGNAVLLNDNQKAAMRPFSPDAVLDLTRIFALTGKRVNNPTFYPKLIQMGFEVESLPDFTKMAAITFVDTVVFHVAVENRTLFHELVHVIEYQKLGLDGFAAKYVRGFMTGSSYDAIPLEMNAYELDARFAAAPTSAFSVEDEVQEWRETGNCSSSRAADS